MLSGFPYYFSYASHYQGERQATHGQKRNSEDRKATGGVCEPVFWISNIPLLLYLIKIKSSESQSVGANASLLWCSAECIILGAPGQDTGSFEFELYS